MSLCTRLVQCLPLLLVACTFSHVAYVCDVSDDCVRPGGEKGVCQADGNCSYDDTACGSGLRYGAHAAEPIAGTCVPDAADAAGPQASAGGDDGSSGSDDGATSGDDGADDDPDDDAGGTGSGAMGEDPCALELRTIPAVTVACASDEGHGPDECEQEAGWGYVMADTSRTSFGGARTTVYLAFDLGGPSGVEAAELSLWVASDDESDGSGELWRVDPFDVGQLGSQSPALTDEVPLADDQGAVTSGDQVVWPLDPEAVEGVDIAFVAIVATSDDAIRYVANAPSGTPVLYVSACAE